MSNRGRPLGEILEEKGYVTQAQVRDAVAKQADEGVRIGEMLVSLGHTTAERVTEALSEQFGLEVIDLEKVNIPPNVTQIITRNMAKDHCICPVARENGVLKLATADPLDLYAMDAVRFTINMDVECVLATREAIEEAINRFYGADEATVQDLLQEFTESDITFVEGDLEEGDEEIEDDAPVIKLVTLIISEALKQRASDIHVEPMERKLRIRYRVDGVCFEVESPPKRLQGPLLSRIKIMSGMDIAERRKPQDGRIKLTLMGRNLDLRVSALPTNHGESIVMRILDREAIKVNIRELGFEDVDYERFQRIIRRPNGIFLVTGPTGSGKTTTLYAALNELNRPDVKIITAENPVEYHFPGINQSQVHERVGLTFGRILRAMMRQAPDIILVGEIRDEETAETAVHAALTGHLVFSTLHTNDAPSALTRLIDLGVAPFLVSSSVQAIMAQRLVRLICEACKQEHTYGESELRSVGVDPATNEAIFYAGGGCDECKGSGFRGRIAIFELMEMNLALRELAFNSAPVTEIRREAMRSGMTDLLHDGVKKVMRGLTMISEILNVAKEVDSPPE